MALLGHNELMKLKLKAYHIDFLFITELKYDASCCFLKQILLNYINNFELKKT